jgi:2-dehydro-3-deoxy-D-arabinonate dehydratase
LGPAITLAPAMPARETIAIKMEIERGSTVVFRGETSIARMARRFEELIEWLARDNLFPTGVYLLTGTGIVPPTTSPSRPVTSFASRSTASEP